MGGERLGGRWPPTLPLVDQVVGFTSLTAAARGESGSKTPLERSVCSPMADGGQFKRCGAKHRANRVWGLRQGWSLGLLVLHGVRRWLFAHYTWPLTWGSLSHKDTLHLEPPLRAAWQVVVNLPGVTVLPLEPLNGNAEDTQLRRRASTAYGDFFGDPQPQPRSLVCEVELYGRGSNPDENP